MHLCSLSMKGGGVHDQSFSVCMSSLSRSIPEKHPVQTMAVAYWTFHYAKRIFETFFVHRWGSDSFCVNAHACVPHLVPVPVRMAVWAG